jgi:ribose-phosphate pyrophosphokinase
VTTLAVHAFPDEAAPARALAEALGAPLSLVDLHAFPDGEVLPTVPGAAHTVLVYCSLDHPNEKLIPLLLAADAWRRAGAVRLVLVAPYLCYLRQDQVFAPGQPVSRDVIGALLGTRFDRLATVQAHLHRTPDLSAVFGDIRAESLSAIPLLAAAIGQGGPAPLIVGPDVESTALIDEAARLLKTDSLAFRKLRLGDREVQLEADDLERARGRRVVVLDDVCSSGATVMGVVKQLRRAGAARVELAVAHALFSPRTAWRLRWAGVSRIISTDSVAHPTNAVSLAPLLARALSDETLP